MERFVYAWTHQHLDLNAVVRSRAEGCHSIFKRYITVRYFVLHKLHLANICMLPRVTF
jgi:hypothetical protein